MKKSLKSIIISGLFCISCVVYALTPNQLLDQKLQGFKSLSANFNQTVSSDDGAVLQKSSGSFVILRPGKFNWTVKLPITQELITDGQSLWIYEPDLEQVTIRKLGTNLGQTPLVLLTNQHANLKNSFNVSQVNDHTFVLLPKSSKDNFKKVTLTFTNNTPASLSLINQLNQSTTINFSNVKLNPPVNVNQFRFAIPKGVDVINLTKRGAS